MIINLVLISITANGFSAIYAYFFNQEHLFLFNISLCVSTIIGYLIFKANYKDASFHFILIAHIISFTCGGFYGYNYYSGLLLYVLSMLLTFFITNNHKVHLFYFIGCLICCIIFTYYLPEVSKREEPYRFVLEIIFTLGISSVLFTISKYYMSNINENEKYMKSQNLLIKNQNDSLNHKNQDLQKYIHSNIQLEQFAHIASHDLKSPLRTISSYTGLLKRKLYDKIDTREKEHFDFIEKGTKKMSALINDLLQYSKANSQEIVLEKNDMNDILNQVILDLEFDLENCQASIIYNGLPTQIYVDEIKMKQVFQNLISNSIKFMSDNKKPKIIINGEQKDNFHEINITDNGIGIDSKYVELIFKPFQRLHHDDAFEGTGMGLTICKKIIEQHGGQLWLDESYSGGAKFHFTIPNQN